MRVIRDISRFMSRERSAVAVGVFDGMHRAHRGIISRAVDLARRSAKKSIVLTFWPHPQGEPSLNSLEHRLRMIEELGVDICVVLRFDRSFARISPEDFVKDILLKRLNAEVVFVGDNFRFGKNAEGDVRLLEKLSRALGFKVKVFRVFKTGNVPVSSTLIRRLISSGELGRAQKLLARPVSVLGAVIKGRSIAAGFGFPTANIDPHHEILPPAGIYAVKVILASRQYKGVCYIGTRPTLLLHRQSVEVHIFGFRKNIYGEVIEIRFIRKVREEKKFLNLEELVKQIKKDIIKAKNILSRH